MLIGIDWGGTKIEGVAMERDGRELLRLREATPRHDYHGCLKTIRHARQFRTVMAPLFPGYLFVSLDLTRDRWRSVNGTIGVVSLVMSGGEPRAAPRGVVEALVALSREGTVRFDFDLQVGQRIRMIAGPRMTMNSDGKMHPTSGNSILIGALAACSSARWRRSMRSVPASTTACRPSSAPMPTRRVAQSR